MFPTLADFEKLQEENKTLRDLLKDYTKKSIQVEVKEEIASGNNGYVKLEMIIGRDKERTIEMLQMLANGECRKEIASKFRLSYRTVEAIIAKHIEKFECKGQLHLVAVLIREGIIK